MRKIKKLIITFMVSLVLFCGTSVILPEVSGMETVEAAAVKLNKTRMTLKVGQKYRLKVIGTNKKIKWKSGKPKVASVGPKGFVTAKAAGITRIVATVGGKKYTCLVTVKAIPKPTNTPTPIPVQFNASTKSLEINEKGTVEITYTGKGSLRYNIENPSICSCKINDNNYKHKIKTLVISGKNSGSTNIIISNNYDNRTIKIRVTVDLYAKSITLNENNKTLLVGESFTLTANVSPSYVKNKSVSWKSDNNNIATVSSLGRVSGKSEGTTIITATSADKKCFAQCTVTVKNKYPENITLFENNIELRVGESSRVSYVVYPFDADTDDLEWTSSNNSVATVSSNGYVEGISEGKAVITVSSSKGECKAECTITVKGYSDAVIQTPKLPLTIKSPTKSCTISGFGMSKITIGITRCIISVNGIKDADNFGDSSCSIGYKLYKDGAVIESGYLTTPVISVGDNFKVSTPTFILQPGLYQFELTDIR